MFSKLVVLTLLTIAGAAPTAAPSSAPTSAATDAPDSTTSPTLAPTTKPTTEVTEEPESTSTTSTEAPSSNKTTTEATKGNGTTAAPVKPVTTFTAKLKLQAAADFDQGKYLQALAAASGADAENIRVISVAYEVTTQYKFADDVTAADVVKAVAKQLSVAEDKVNATVASVAARRLREGRRLAVTADVTVFSDSAAAADKALADLNNTAALATEMNVTAPEVVSAGVTVSVVSEITSTTGTAVAAPAAADVASEMGTLIGKPVDVEITDVVQTEDPSASTTTTDPGAESSHASAKALVTPLALLAAVVSSFVF